MHWGILRDEWYEVLLKRSARSIRCYAGCSNIGSDVHTKKKNEWVMLSSNFSIDGRTMTGRKIRRRSLSVLNCGWDFHSGVNVTAAWPLSLHLQQPAGALSWSFPCNVKNPWRPLWDLEWNWMLSFVPGLSYWVWCLKWEIKNKKEITQQALRNDFLIHHRERSFHSNLSLEGGNKSV